MEPRGRGTRAAGPDGTGRPQSPFTAQVRAYLRDCAANPQLNKRYHPTQDGVLKVVWHRNARDAEQILAIYAREVRRGTMRSV